MNANAVLPVTRIKRGENEATKLDLAVVTSRPKRRQNAYAEAILTTVI